MLCVEHPDGGKSVTLTQNDLLPAGGSLEWHWACVMDGSDEWCLPPPGAVLPGGTQAIPARTFDWLFEGPVHLRVLAPHDLRCFRAYTFQKASPVTASPSLELDAETAQKLAALGYVEGATGWPCTGCGAYWGGGAYWGCFPTTEECYSSTAVKEIAFHLGGMRQNGRLCFECRSCQVRWW